ncbi:hypothetical protein D3C76_1303480 [compost metagenome]
MQRFESLGQAFVRCAWAQGINNHIHALAMRNLMGPFVGRNSTERVNFNSPRSCEVFHLLKQILIAGSAENFTST